MQGATSRYTSHCRWEDETAGRGLPTHLHVPRLGNRGRQHFIPMAASRLAQEAALLLYNLTL